MRNDTMRSAKTGAFISPTGRREERPVWFSYEYNLENLHTFSKNGAQRGVRQDKTWENLHGYRRHLRKLSNVDKEK